MGGVDAVDVEARVGLGVAQRLRLGQDVAEVAAALAHRGQDVVRGAVEDAVDALEPVRGQPLPQGLDDRDAARDRRLEGERHACPLGQPRQLGAVMGQHGLVGGDDRLALGQSPPRQTRAPRRRRRRSARRRRRPRGRRRASARRRARARRRASTPRLRARSRALTAVTTRRLPVRCSISRSLRRRRASVPAPTVPSPAMPTFRSSVTARLPGAPMPARHCRAAQGRP